MDRRKPLRGEERRSSGPFSIVYYFTARESSEAWGEGKHGTG